MKKLAVIPARGGSKRIPRKNIKDFLGKPIIAYSIETALESNLFDEVMVSTDDQEIANVAKKYGAKVPFMRSAENANDYATTVDVLLEVVDEYQRRGMKFGALCCLYPTAPFVSLNDLKMGFELLNKATSSLPVVEFDFPVLRALKQDEDQNISFAWPEHEKMRSQDMESYYHDAGQWYWVMTKELESQKTLVTDNCKVIKKDRMSVQDIDTVQDWQLAELKYQVISE